MDSTDGLLGGGVNGLERLAVDTFNIFVVDETARSDFSALDLTGEKRDLLLEGSDKTYRPVGCVYLPPAGVWSSTEVMIAVDSNYLVVFNYT